MPCSIRTVHKPHAIIYEPLIVVWPFIIIVIISITVYINNCVLNALLEILQFDGEMSAFGNMYAGSPEGDFKQVSGTRGAHGL